MAQRVLISLNCPDKPHLGPPTHTPCPGPRSPISGQPYALGPFLSGAVAVLVSSSTTACGSCWAGPGLCGLSPAILEMCLIQTSRLCLRPASSLRGCPAIRALGWTHLPPLDLPSSGTLELGTLHVGCPRVGKEQIRYSRQRTWKSQFKIGKFYQSLILIYFIVLFF